MALAIELFKKTNGQKAKELTALDAPVETQSYWEVMKAASYVQHVSNYYVPTLPSNRSQLAGFVSGPDGLHLDAPFGFGAAILGDTSSSIDNYELSWLNENSGPTGHNNIVDRYAGTAHVFGLLPADSSTSPWSFETSYLTTGSVSSGTRLWVEGAVSQFEPVPFDSSIALEVEGQLSQMGRDSTILIGKVTNAADDTFVATAGAAFDAYSFGVDGAITISNDVVTTANVVTEDVTNAASGVWNYLSNGTATVWNTFHSTGNFSTVFNTSQL